MKFNEIYNRLQSYQPPDGWPGHIFLLPKDVMEDIYKFIISHKLRSVIELGTGYGATTCVIASALQEIGGGKIITIDKYLHQSVNIKVLMQYVGLKEEQIEVVVDELGYNWYMADLIKKQTIEGNCSPIYDFCLLDGAHEWEPDALAFTLVAMLLKPGAWIALDDVNFNLRMVPNWKEDFPNYSDRELDAFQVNMVYSLIVEQHPDFYDFQVTHKGRIGWARKNALLSGNATLGSRNNRKRRSVDRYPRLSRAMTIWHEQGLLKMINEVLRYYRKRF